MNELAQLLHYGFYENNAEKNGMIDTAKKEYNLSKDVEITYALVNTAQETLCDLDKSISELSMLVENLKHQSARLSDK